MDARTSIWPGLLIALVIVAGARSCHADTPELRYTQALVAAGQLEDAVRSLRAAILYAQKAGLDTDGAAAVLAASARDLASITAALQPDELKPDIGHMDFDALSARDKSALARTDKALAALRKAPALSPPGPPRPGFAPLPRLKAGSGPLQNHIVFAALGPTQKWAGWRQGPAAWQVLRALGLQSFSPYFGWYWKPGKPTSWAQEPERMQRMFARLWDLGFPTLLWLEPEYNVDNLWKEIGDELYLHDSQGEWRRRTRINNTINVFNPRVREAVCAGLRRLARSQRGDQRILAYELVEEPALRFDISDPNSPDHEPRLGGYSKAARTAFRQWLEKKYKTIAELNRDWASEYTSFASVRPPAHLARKQGAWQGPQVALLAEFQEFRAAEHAEYFRQMVAAVHEGNPEAVVMPRFTTPLFGDPLGGVDLFRMSQAGWDLATFHTEGSLAYDYSLARYAGKPIWNSEYIWSGRAPREATGERRLRAVAAINLWRNLAWGAQGFILFNLDFAWKSPKDGGDWNNDLLNGHLNYLAPRYAAGVFPEILRKPPTFFDSLYHSKVVDEGLMILEPTTSIYTAVPTGTSQWWATRIAAELGRASYRPAFCPERYLVDGRENLSGYRVLVVPVGTYMPEAVCRRLWEWTRAGGVLIAVGPFARYDNFGKPRPATAPFGAVKPGEEVAVGKGRVVSIAFRGTPPEILARVRKAVDEAIGTRAALASDPSIELILRRRPDGGRLLVALNADTQRHVKGQITVAGKCSCALDITVEHGIRVPCRQRAAGIGLPVSLDPGEARVFLLLP